MLGLDHAALYRITKTGLPAGLRRFLAKGEKIETWNVQVVAANSPYQGREITFYPTPSIEMLLRVYSLALGHGALRAGQEHIGRRALLIQTALATGTLLGTIRQSCGLKPKIAKLVREQAKLLEEHEKELLGLALRYAYPKVEGRGQNALLGHCSRLACQGVLSAVEQRELQGKKGTQPLYTYLSEEAQKKYQEYQLLLSAQMLLHHAPLKAVQGHAQSLWEKIGHLQNQEEGVSLGNANPVF